MNISKRYKIKVAYDGTDYVGWIQQPNQRSIVETLHNTFHTTFGKTIRLLGASKTDAGVHALGQVAVFVTDLSIDAQKMMSVWNNTLPESIVIQSLSEDESFHPHQYVELKTYWYHIFLDRPLPMFARYGWYAPELARAGGKDVIPRLESMLQHFVGTHDFHAFYTGNDKGDDTIRIIDSIGITYLPEYTAYRIEVRGKKFLTHMVRRMVGAAVAAATRGDVIEQSIMDALRYRKIHYELPTAPAKGLMLAGIQYKE